ncbi:Endonuclease/exonuclease/phosphatase [Trametes meyenii]|nr:Endonuclease/exonuclease/phosphatase [Trametes meyenii]
MTTSGDTLLPLKAKGYSFRKKKWISHYRHAKETPTELRLLTWNVDFMGAHNDDRIRRILGYLETAILSSTPAPSVILLQELDVRSQAAILASEWVRKHYAMFPTTPEPWPHQYGNATLVSRSIPFQNAQMLQFANSRMGRTAIFVDVPIRLTDSVTRVVRIANTHLESLPQGTKMRPKQLSVIAEMLRARDVGAGVVGGDMNMIGDHKDQTIHVAAGLDDACQSPDDPSCYTWGYQPPTSFPPRRLDRVFFTGKHVCVGDVEVVGKDLRTKKGQWVSDHCGLVTSIGLHS